MSDVEERPIRWGMGDAALGLLASLVLSVIGSGIVFGITGAEEVDDLSLAATAVLQVPLWAALLGIPVLVSRRKGLGTLREDFGFTMVPRDVPVGLVIGLAAQFAITLLTSVLFEVLGLDTEKLGETAERLADRAVGPVDAVLLVVIVAVGAPVFEELFYRGLWLRSIERRFGTAAGVVGSSVLFGLIHFQPWDAFALTLAGLLFATLAVRAGRLGPAIWAHVGFNLTAVVALLSA